MNEELIRCQKCGGEMLKGFVADYAEKNVRYARWYEGEPRSAILWEIDPTKNQMWKLEGHRCTRCGFIEFYAVVPG